MSGGVRNLRAMFENKDVATSPPDRGRSPAGSIGPGSSGTSPRPLSKVRTSFVAVERSGQLGNQLGLKRENSGEPSMAKRRTSFSIDEEEHPQIKAERKQSIATEFDARKNSKVIEEIIPEVAVETPSIEVDKKLGGDTKTTKATKGMKTLDGAVDLKKAAASKGASNGHTNSSSKGATTEKTVDKPSSSKFSGRPTPISIAKTSTTSKASPKSVKSPATPKTPTTPRGRPKDSAKQPEKNPEKREPKATASSHTAKPTSKPSTSTAASAAPKTRIPPSPPQTGFVKPKPRSPTRPIKLPASLTAHTASSGSKTAGAAPPATSITRSLSRASGNSQNTNPLQTHPTLSRSPSRASTATAPKTLARKPSTLNKSHVRPSLGPPPAKQVKKQPSRQSLPSNAPADEGFLARMMRPTTSSASKTAEKVTTPPKRAQSVKRPATRDGPPKHNVPKAAAPKMGSLVAEPAAEEIKPAASTSVAEKTKEASKLAPIEKSGAEIAEVSATPEKKSRLVDEGENSPKSSEIQKSPAEDSKDMEADVGENSTKSPEIQEPATEDAKDMEADVGSVEGSKSVTEPSPTVLEKIPEMESTPEKQAPTVELVSAPDEAVETEETFVAVEEPAVPEAKEEVPEKSEVVKAVGEDAERLTTEPGSEPGSGAETAEAMEIEIPKEVEIVEDPEDVRVREEIAKLNAEFLQAETATAAAAADEEVE